MVEVVVRRVLMLTLMQEEEEGQHLVTQVEEVVELA